MSLLSSISHHHGFQVAGRVQLETEYCKYKTEKELLQLIKKHPYILSDIAANEDYEDLKDQLKIVDAGHKYAEEYAYDGFEGFEAGFKVAKAYPHALIINGQFDDIYLVTELSFSAWTKNLFNVYRRNREFAEYVDSFDK